MRSNKTAAALALGLLTNFLIVAFAAAQMLLTGVGSVRGTLPTGTPTAIIFPTTQFTSITDLLPLKQYVDGYTSDIIFQGLAPAGVTTAYAPGTVSAQGIAFNKNSPGFDSSGNATTVTMPMFTTSWLRQTYSNNLLPTEASNSGNAKTAWTWNDFLYAGDTPSTASAIAAVYTGSGSVTSVAASGIPVTNNSGKTWPLPVGAWITEPGLLLTATAPVTVEFVGGQAYGQGGKPLATVTMTMTDGTNSVSHAATLAISKRLWSTTCTGTTNGSNVLTGCTDTSALQVGERLTVPGIPGQPKISALTSSTITLSAPGMVTLTNVSSTITVTNNTVANGDGLADGLFVGQTVTCANINAGIPATVTAEGTPTIVSNKTTQVTFTINTSVTTAVTNQSCTFNHNYQGTTGTPVTVTLGNPVPTWQATFTAAEQATLTDGNVWFRAQAKPVIGNVVLDSQLGANNATGAGSNVDWNGKTLAVNGTDVTPNLHNLMAYKDTMSKYGQTWAWVSGTQTAGGSPAVQTSATDPGSTAYYANAGTACQQIASYNGTHYGHTDANGSVIYIHSGTQTTGLGTFSTCTTKSGPRLLIANAPADAQLSATIQTQSNAIIIAPRITFKGLSFLANTSGSVSVITGGDLSIGTGASMVTELLFDQDKFVTTVSAPMSIRVGEAAIYNSFIDESVFDGFLLRSNSNTSSALKMLAGSTVIGGAFGTSVANYSIFNAIGNTTWGLGVAQPPSYGEPGNTAVLAQPLSYFIGFNKFMGATGTFSFQHGPVNNLYMTTNIIEMLNAAAVNPALRISADDDDAPLNNVSRIYDEVQGSRTNGPAFLEGLPPASNGVTTGGSLAAGPYQVQVVYANASTPGTEASTNGPVAVTVGGSGSGSITITNYADPTYVLNVYISTAGGGSVTNIATVTAGVTTGVAGTGILTGQTLTITGIGAAQTPMAGLPGKNEIKFPYFQRFTFDINYTQKNETYGASGATANGGRVGNWPGLWRAGWLGTVNATGSFIGTATPSSTSGLGSVIEPYGVYATNTANIISLIKPKSNRSWGSNTSTVTVPALNIGQGNYAPDVSVTGGQTVPAAMAAWPYDIQGQPRLNTGGGYAGPYEGDDVSNDNVEFGTEMKAAA